MSKRRIRDEQADGASDQPSPGIVMMAADAPVLELHCRHTSADQRAFEGRRGEATSLRQRIAWFVGLLLVPGPLLWLLLGAPAGAAACGVSACLAMFALRGVARRPPPSDFVARLGPSFLESESDDVWVRYGPGAFSRVSVEGSLIVFTDGEENFQTIAVRHLPPEISLDEFLRRGERFLAAPADSDWERPSPLDAAAPAPAADSPGGSTTFQWTFLWGASLWQGIDWQKVKPYPSTVPPPPLPRGASPLPYFIILGLAAWLALRGPAVPQRAGLMALGAALAFTWFLGVALVFARRNAASPAAAAAPETEVRLRVGRAGWERRWPHKQRFNRWDSIERIKLSDNLILFTGGVADLEVVHQVLPRSVFADEAAMHDFLDWALEELPGAEEDAGAKREQMPGPTSNPYQAPQG